MTPPAPAREKSARTSASAYGLLVLGAVLGVVSIGCALIPWKSGNRITTWINAPALFINAIPLMGGFWNVMPGFMLFLTSAFITVTAVTIVLILQPRYKMVA